MEDHINTEIAQLAALQEKRPAMPQREWSGFLREVYVSRKPPVTGTVDVKKLEGLAREKLKDRQGASSFPLPLPRFAPRCLPHGYTRGTSHG